MNKIMHNLSQAYEEWDSNPIITSVSTTARSIKSLEWPSITICGQGRDTSLIDRVIHQQVKRDVEVGQYQNRTAK